MPDLKNKLSIEDECQKKIYLHAPTKQHKDIWLQIILYLLLILNKFPPFCQSQFPNREITDGRLRQMNHDMSVKNGHLNFITM